MTIWLQNMIWWTKYKIYCKTLKKERRKLKQLKKTQKQLLKNLKDISLIETPYDYFIVLEVLYVCCTLFLALNILIYHYMIGESLWIIILGSPFIIITSAFILLIPYYIISIITYFVLKNKLI